MMDCARYRRSLLADPNDADQALRAHRETCTECAAFTVRLQAFEARLERALRIPVESTADRVALGGQDVRAEEPPAEQGGSRAPGSDIDRDRRKRRSESALPSRFGAGWLALAASALIALGVGGMLWIVVPGRSLAADVVGHMAGEPDAWRRTLVPVPAPALADVMSDAHVRLVGPPGIVSYASSCSFHGHQVPHLVMQTADGPVTVMVLRYDRVMKAVRFDEEGYRGVIVPVHGHGSLAVLTRGDEKPAAIERLAERVQHSLVWTD